jgi:hypothetical protein
MRYLLMSNIDPVIVGAMTPEAHAAMMQRFVTFTQALAESGVLRGAEQLQSADTATTVRVRDEQLLLTDGPYADVAEFFGGYWTVETPDLDTALKYAQDCPASGCGSVEVRALVELG